MARQARGVGGSLSSPNATGRSQLRSQHRHGSDLPLLPRTSRKTCSPTPPASGQVPTGSPASLPSVPTQVTPAAGGPHGLWRSYLASDGRSLPERSHHLWDHPPHRQGPTCASLQGSSSHLPASSAIDPSPALPGTALGRALIPIPTTGPKHPGESDPQGLPQHPWASAA